MAERDGSMDRPLSSTPHAAAPRPVRPQQVAELAHTLGVLQSTLWRALRNDPAAPPPAEHTYRGMPLYDPQAVAAWWPNRRRRGKPAARPPRHEDEIVIGGTYRHTRGGADVVVTHYNTYTGDVWWRSPEGPGLADRHRTLYLDEFLHVYELRRD